MCNQCKRLAALDNWRYVSQCEHQTVHLRWNHLTISLPPQAFLQLARTILQERTGESMLPLYPTAPSLSTAEPKPVLRLRLNTVLLEFASVDLPMFCHLLQQAIDSLTQNVSPSAVRFSNPTVALQPCPQPTNFSLTQHLN